jgi:hypothetical protein
MFSRRTLIAAIALGLPLVLPEMPPAHDFEKVE